MAARQGVCSNTCGLREALLVEKTAREAAESALAEARCQLEELQCQLDHWERRERSRDAEACQSGEELNEEESGMQDDTEGGTTCFREEVDVGIPGLETMSDPLAKEVNEPLMRECSLPAISTEKTARWQTSIEAALGESPSLFTESWQACQRELPPASGSSSSIISESDFPWTSGAAGLESMKFPGPGPRDMEGFTSWQRQSFQVSEGS